MKKILLIAPSWVGDAVMSQPLITRLKNSNKECLIDVLAPPWVCPIFQFMDNVNKTLLSPFKHGQLKLKERLAFGSFLRRLSYDECYILPNSFKSALIPFFARIPVRIGYVGECRYPLLTKFLSLDKKQVPLMVDRFTNLASRKGKKVENKRKWPELSVSEIAKLAIRKQFLNATTQKIACFCPGAEFGPSKIWPYKKYAHVAKYLTWQGYLVVAVGSENDAAIGTNIAKESGNLIMNLCGKTSIGQAITLLATSDLVISNDSGLMHVAAALNRPLIAIFGSSSPQFTPPLSNKALISKVDLPCSPCFKRSCPLNHTNCLNNISVRSVEKQIEQLLLSCAEEQVNDMSYKTKGLQPD